MARDAARGTARGSIGDMSPWRRRSLTIPPHSLGAWLHLAAWEIWMGMLVAIAIGFGVSFIRTSPGKIVTIYDFSACYLDGAQQPCERIVYRAGMMNVAFTALVGVMLLGVAAWLLWELWNAVEPKPIADDFLKLLNDSFGHDWRNPLRWPWERMAWAYGFSSVGVIMTAGIALVIWMFVVVPKAPVVKVDTSQSFRVP